MTHSNVKNERYAAKIEPMWRSDFLNLQRMHPSIGLLLLVMVKFMWKWMIF